MPEGEERASSGLGRLAEIGTSSAGVSSEKHVFIVRTVG